MACVQYKEIALRGNAMRMVRKAIEIFEDPENAGQVMTLRQLYYQFIGCDYFPNNKLSYRKLARVMSDARIAGLIDWDLIEDRGRMPLVWASQESPEQAVKQALASFNLDHHVGQKNHVELWVEKDALSGVLRPIAEEFEAVLSVNKGYSSSSAVRMAAERMLSIAERFGRPTTILYVGDFDPSGEDMTRDLTERLELFGVQDLTFKKIALTMPQIRQYKLPTNPVKIKDSRAREYVRQHGKHSWEVDALKNSVLTKTIQAEFRSLLDMKLFDAITEKQEVLRADAIRRVGEKREQVTLHIPDVTDPITVEANEIDTVKLYAFANLAQARIAFGDDEQRKLEEREEDHLLEIARKEEVITKSSAVIDKLQDDADRFKAERESAISTANKNAARILELEAKIKTLTTKKKG